MIYPFSAGCRNGGEDVEMLVCLLCASRRPVSSSSSTLLLVSSFLAFRADFADRSWASSSAFWAASTSSGGSARMARRKRSLVTCST